MARPRRADNEYVAGLGKRLPLTPEMADLLRRRTEPFLDSFGMQRPLSMVMQEVYLRGIRDALDAMTSKQ